VHPNFLADAARGKLLAVRVEKSERAHLPPSMLLAFWEPTSVLFCQTTQIMLKKTQPFVTAFVLIMKNKNIQSEENGEEQKCLFYCMEQNW
jgi:hypothetical protein